MLEMVSIMFLRSMFVALGASLLASSLVLSGCVDRPGLDDDGGGDGSTSSSSASATAASMVTTNEPTTGGSTGSGSTDGADGSSDDAMTSVGFTCISGSDDPWHCSADAPPPSFECDLYLQDCPEGEKCMPWANDGSGVWNHTRCSPIDPMPSEVGASCTVEGSGFSGIDSCGLGAMCWDVDPNTNVGECVAMCGGNEINPICADPDTSCAMHNDGAIVLCLPLCDPLLIDCGDPDDVCVPSPGDIWTCVPGVSRGIPVGQACGYGNSCEAGSVCARPEVFAACEEGAPGCCAPMCDLAEPMCPEGTNCEPWFPRGEAPPFFDDTGICSAIPMDPRQDWVDFDSSPLIEAGS